MARVPLDSVAALLRKTPLPNAVRRDAWDAFHVSKSPEEFAVKLQQLPLPKVVRADLWDLKARQAKTPREPAKEQQTPGTVSQFIDSYFHHYNAATLKRAGEAYRTHLEQDGQILLAMAGAFSTGELGRCLAPMIREGKVHAISCTGANLEESLMDLVGHDDYEPYPDYHEHTAEDDAALAARHVNRVTDVGIPETAMRPIEEAMAQQLEKAAQRGESVFPHEVLYDIIRSSTLEPKHQADPADCWLLAAAEKDLPIVVPGWEDSTLGNVFAAQCLDHKFHSSLIKGGIEYMLSLAKWYEQASAEHPMGFVQLGGGIAGDFSICVVPMLEQDAHRKDTPLWEYFVQLTDADESMGGYSGALPNEKSSWKKLPAEAPMFNVKGDFSINFPLLAAMVLGW